MPVASAQVKSGILLAGLFADSPTTIIEPGPARDHTERMLRAMGANVQIDGARITIIPGALLHPLDLTIPGDISSAAFLLIAAAFAASDRGRDPGDRREPDPHRHSGYSRARWARL